METTGIWVAFTAFILVLLALDLTVFHRHAREQSLREALAWSGGWIGLALLFNLGMLWWWDGAFPGHAHPAPEAALLFLTGYLIELSLSVDNLFVMALVFARFGIPPQYQRRVLFWGILGALVMRGAMIAGGVALIHAFHGVLYVFGAFLVFSGLRMLRREEGGFDPARSRTARLIGRILPVTPSLEGERFFVVRGGVRMATPLFLALLIIEAADLVFAVDSIPAIFGVTLDPFLVYASNVFAILGLRSLYFVLAGFMGLFRHLKPALAAILVFVGAKMLLAGLWKIPPQASLAVVAAILAIALLASARSARKERKARKARKAGWRGSPRAAARISSWGLRRRPSSPDPPEGRAGR